MSLKKYIPRSIQNVFNRLEAFNESIVEKLFSEDLDKTFEVIVYCSKNPETRTETPATDLSTDVANYNFFKARSTVGHHDHLIEPQNAKSIDEYERLRNLNFQATLKKSSDQELPETGDVWLATKTGAGIVSLISRERKGDPTKFIIPEGAGAAQAAHTNGQNPTTSVGNAAAAAPAPAPAATSSTPAYSGPSTTPAPNIDLPVYDAVQKELLAYISAGEGGYDASNNGTSDTKSGYDGRIVNSFGKKSYVAYMNVTATQTSDDQKLLSTLTIGEIVDFQGYNAEWALTLKNATFVSRYPNTSDRTLFAVGAYQIVPATMQNALKQTGYGRDVVFTPEVQQNLAMSLIYGTKREILRKYLKGDTNITNHQAMDSFAKEWSSIPSATKYENGWTSKVKPYVGLYHPPGGDHSHYDYPNRAGHTYAETKALLEKVRKHNMDNGFTE